MNKKAKIVCLATLVGTLLFSGTASAWGPERTWYTNESPANHAVFNSIKNNAAVGSEADFVRIVEIKDDGEVKDDYTDEITVEPGKEYEVWIYYHNDASTTFNDEQHNYVGVAREVKVATQFPTTLGAGERKDISATISWKNFDLTDGDPGKVWDEAYITANEKVDIKYKTASAKIYNDWDVNGSVLSTDLFSPDGTYIGLNELNGIILGCDEYSGQIVYHIEVTGHSAPVNDCTTNPELPECQTIPETGPIEIVMATIIVVCILGVVFYFCKTRRELSKVTENVSGKDTQEQDTMINDHEDE